MATTTMFSPEQLAALAAPLDRAKVRQREQGRSKVSYLEGWQVIAEANRIFGFDGWQRETMAVQCVAERERTLGSSGRSGWGVTYTARVRITVGDGTGHLVIREGSGAGHGIDADLGLAHESALKEAETDAMKRALMTFGNPFGLALYDKQQREVTRSASEQSQSQAAGRPQSGIRPLQAAQAPQQHPDQPPAAQLPAAQLQPQAPSAPADPAETPLSPEVIRSLLNVLRALPQPLLGQFNRAFRLHFAIPADAPTIANRICQQRHHDWIEAWLLEHQGQMALGLQAR